MVLYLFHPPHFYSLTMIFWSLLGPTPTIVILQPMSSSIRARYFFTLSGSSLYDLMWEISPQPSISSYTGLQHSKSSRLAGKCLMICQLNSYPTQILTTSKSLSTSILLSAISVKPLVLTAYSPITESNQPQRLGRPVTVPNS